MAESVLSSHNRVKSLGFSDRSAPTVYSMPSADRAVVQLLRSSIPSVRVFLANTPIRQDAFILNFGQELNLHYKGNVTRLDVGIAYDQKRGDFVWQAEGTAKGSLRCVPFQQYLSPLAIAGRFLDRLVRFRPGHMSQLKGSTRIGGEDYLRLHEALLTEKDIAPALIRDPRVVALLNFVFGSRQTGLSNITAIEAYAFKREVYRDIGRVIGLASQRLGAQQVSVAGPLIHLVRNDDDFLRIVNNASQNSSRLSHAA